MSWTRRSPAGPNRDDDDPLTTAARAVAQRVRDTVTARELAQYLDRSGTAPKRADDT